MADTKLRILIISDVNSAHVLNWVDFLSELEHTVTLLSVRPGDLSNAEVIYCDPGDVGSRIRRIVAHAKFLWKEWRLIMNGGFDIVHVHFLRADAIGLVATFHPDSVITVWGSDARPVGDGGDGRRLWLKKATLRKAKLVTATNEFLKLCVHKLVPDIERIEVVSFGVFPHELTSTVNEHDSIRFIFAKPNLIPLYGIDLLIKAFIVVSEQLPDVSLTVVGDGDKEFVDNLKMKIKSNGIESKVIFRSKLSRAELFDEMVNSDIMVQPSRWESFGVVMLEGMSVGLPVISTNVGGVPEIVRHDVTGKIVPADNLEALTTAMINLATDSALRERLGQEGKRMVAEEYNFKIHGNKMNDLYYELVTKPKS